MIKHNRLISSVLIGGTVGSTIANYFFTTLIPLLIGGLIGMVIYWLIQRKD